MTKVSVIVPVYNVEKYIDRCIKSLINQSFKDYEIVIVNDGSRDNSQKIIDKYVKKYPEKIVSYIKENGGVSSARNYGINNARGKYLTFVDSDDYVSKDYLKLLYDKITENDNDMVFSDVYKKKNDVTEVMMGLRSENIDIHKNALISLPATWNKMYKKSLFTNNNIIYPEEIRLGEDLATITKLILHAKNIGYVNTPIYYYIIREGSATNQKDFNSKFLDIFKVFFEIINYYKENNKLNEYKDELEYLAIFHILHSVALNVCRYEKSYEIFDKINNYMKENFSDWNKNKYYKKENWKFKFVCFLISKKQIKILRKVLK